MIDLKVKAKKQEDFEDLPIGKYTVEVVSVDDWEKKELKNAQISVRDDDGYVVKNEKGKPQKQTIPNLVFYTAKTKLKVIDGEHNGRFITTFLTTHPDALFITEGFLYAIDETEMSVDDMPTSNPKSPLKGKTLVVDLDYREYEKTITDKDTGIDTVELRRMPNIKKFIRLLF
jgi:hypothetical protein